MIAIRTLREVDAAFPDELDALLERAGDLDSETATSVAAIVEDVRRRGDPALLEYTSRFDRRALGAVADLEIPSTELRAAVDHLDTELKTALQDAADRIRTFHEHQRAESWSFEDEQGCTLGQLVTPLDRVGIYVPGGRAAYPSTVLMNAIPAQVAGVAEIVMVVPAPDGEVNRAVLAAASIAGVTRAFSIGGAQAVAALAYGTATVPRVDKIVGPGNRYVAAAKRLVFGQVGIDMIAGPSEVVVVSDGSSNPEWVAMDLMAQAEHDEDARALLVTTSSEFITRVQGAIDASLPKQARAKIIRASLERNGAFVLVKDLSGAARVVNRIAPEHLELAVSEPESLLPLIRHAGAIFLGEYAAEVIGDYCAGPNHVLPTGGSARFSSPLGVYDFQKRTSLTRCSPEGGATLAGIAAVLAKAEGLDAHAQAARLRALRGK